MKKGMNVWSLPNELSLEEQFSLVKEARFDTIELNLTEEIQTKTIVSEELALSEKKDLTLDADESTLLQIKEYIEKFQLPVSSISTALHWTYPLNDQSEEKRKKGKEIVKKMIDLCSAVGGDTVLVVPALVTAEQPYDEAYNLSIVAFKELALYAQEKRIKIGIENVWNKFLLSPLEMRQFVDEINSEWVGVYFDVGNILQYGFPEQWIRILGKRICKIHVKDFNQKIGNIYGFTQLFQGDVPWSRVIKSLIEIKYDGPLTCELAPYQLNGKQLAYDSSRALDYLLEIAEGMER